MNARPILLDTCALIWLANGDPIAAEAMTALDDAEAKGAAILVSPISAWEIGQLVARRRLSLAMEPTDWFSTALDSGVTLAPMSPNVLIGSSFLPGPILRDPADRIIAATARAQRCRLVTRDRLLLDYAKAGHLEAIAC